jgi:hypothetical protein
MSLWRRPAVRWTVLALLGVVIATAVTIAATRLVGQHVALGGEPSLGGNLVVVPARTTTTTTTPPAPPHSDDRDHEHEHDGDDDD